MTPLVSVCMPTYNGAKFVAEAIESVLHQDFADFELLIIDDCSSDETGEIIERFCRQDARVRAIYNSSNLGMVENWNACLVRARGRYLHYLFGDDLISSPDALSRMVEILENNRSVSLVASSRHLIDSRSERRGLISFFGNGSVTDGSSVIRRCLLEQKNLIGEPSVVMFRREDALRGFDARYRQFVDLEMWFHLLEQGSFAFIGEPLASFRVHDAQQTRKNVAALLHVEEMFMLLDEYLQRVPLKMSSAVVAFLRYNLNYRIWKAHKNGIVSLDEAKKRIGRRLNFNRFLFFMPAYKIFSPLWKLGKALNLV